MIDFERAKEIADLYYYEIYHLCLSRLKRHEDAADVTQEVFLFFQEHCEELDDNLIKSWLLSVADNKIKEEFRKIAKREKELIYGAVFGVQKSTDIIYEIEQDNKITPEEIESWKDKILSSLTEKELRLFEMVYTKQMEYKELAEALDISEGTARTRVCRLNAKLKEKAAFAFMALLLIFIKL